MTSYSLLNELLQSMNEDDELDEPPPMPLPSKPKQVMKKTSEVSTTKPVEVKRLKSDDQTGKDTIVFKSSSSDSPEICLEASSTPHNNRTPTETDHECEIGPQSSYGGYKGVESGNGRFISTVFRCEHFDPWFLGSFSSPLEAAQVYDNACRYLNYPNKFLNFPSLAETKINPMTYELHSPPATWARLRAESFGNLWIPKQKNGIVKTSPQKVNKNQTSSSLETEWTASTTFKGVYWKQVADSKKFLVKVFVKRSPWIVGECTSEIHAARVYDSACKYLLPLLGPSTSLNFPDQVSPEIYIPEWVANALKASLKYNGVTADSKGGTFKAMFKYRNNAPNVWILGHFPTEEEAAKAHDTAVYLTGADPALLNFPEVDYSQSTINSQIPTWVVKNSAPNAKIRELAAKSKDQQTELSPDDLEESEESSTRKSKRGLVVNRKYQTFRSELLGDLNHKTTQTQENPVETKKTEIEPDAVKNQNNVLNPNDGNDSAGAAAATAAAPEPQINPSQMEASKKFQEILSRYRDIENIEAILSFNKNWIAMFSVRDMNCILDYRALCLTKRIPFTLGLLESNCLSERVLSESQDPLIERDVLKMKQIECRLSNTFTQDDAQFQEFVAALHNHETLRRRMNISACQELYDVYTSLQEIHQVENSQEMQNYYSLDYDFESEVVRSKLLKNMLPKQLSAFEKNDRVKISINGMLNDRDCFCFLCDKVIPKDQFIGFCFCASSRFRNKAICQVHRYHAACAAFLRVLYNGSCISPLRNLPEDDGCA